MHNQKQKGTLSAMPPGANKPFEHVPHLSAKPALESAPPGPPLNALTIHESFRALSAGRDCLVDTPYGKPLEAHWAAQTTSTEFTTPAFEESLVLTSSYYLLSAKRRAQERAIAWRALEQAHPYGNPTQPAHGIPCGHETFWLLARRSSSTERVPLMRSTVLLETTPHDTFTATTATLSIRRGKTFQPVVESVLGSAMLYEQTYRLLGQLAKQHTAQIPLFADRPLLTVPRLQKTPEERSLPIAA